MKQIRLLAQYYVDLMMKLGLVRFSMLLALALVVLAIVVQMAVTMVLHGQVESIDVIRSIFFGLLITPWAVYFLSVVVEQLEESRQRLSRLVQKLEEMRERDLSLNVQLKDNIAKVQADGAQLIVVIFHWGNETETVPDSNQTTLGRMAIDLGADLVCGHHPHVLQGIETYKGKNIVYSLGNFCFGGNSSPSDMDTMIYQQTFTIDADGVKNDNVTNIIPCSISSAAYDGYNNYQPTPAEGDEATRILEKINERSSWISTAEGTTFTAEYNNRNTSTSSSESDISSENSSDTDSSEDDISDNNLIDMN